MTLPMEMHFVSMLTDDTYLIIPAVNVDSRPAELHNVNEWALARPNNSKLNSTKSQEIIFTDQRRKTKFPIPDKIPTTSTGTNYQNSWRHIYQ